MSRQFDTATVLLAFGDQLKKGDFGAIGAPERLDQGSGYRRA